MKSVSRGFNSRSGHLIIFQHLFCYFSLRHIGVSLSDDEPSLFLFELLRLEYQCFVTLSHL